MIFAELVLVSPASAFHGKEVCLYLAGVAGHALLDQAYHLRQKSLCFPKSRFLHGLPGISFIEMKCGFG